MIDGAMTGNGVGARSQLKDGALSDNNATSISASDIPATMLLQALGEVQRADVQIYPSHFETNERGDLQFLILLQYEGVSLLHTMNKEERNYLVRTNPALLAACLSNAQRQIADQRGFWCLEDCSITWQPSFIPFHLVYTIVRSDVKCQHLASVRFLKMRSPQQYAEFLLPLAKSFLAKPYGSGSPHLPFIWAPAHSSSPEVLNPEDSKAQRTLVHGQFIVTRFNTVEDMDITTAEATAELINGSKIIPSLLELIFHPEAKKLVPPRPEKVESDNHGPTTNHSGKNDLGIDDFEMTKPEKGNFQQLDRTRKDPKEADTNEVNHKGTLWMIAKRRKTVGSVKTDNSKGLVEPSGAIVNGVAPQKPRETAPKSVHEQQNKDARTKRSKALPVKPATSRKKPKPRKTNPKVSHAPLESPDDNKNGPEILHAKDPFPPRKSSQEPRSLVAHKDNEATKHLKEQAPSPTPECSSHSFIPELSLPGPAYVPQRMTVPRKLILEEELSDLISDTVNENNGISYYSPEKELRPTKALTSNESNSTGYPIRTTQLSGSIGGGGQNLKWAYTTYTDADKALLEAGVWLWERPQTYFYPHQVSIKMSNPYVLAEVIVSHESTGTSSPLIEYSGETVHIIPHDEPWEDVRSIECHPDFLPPCKLVEYQACEAAGYYVWRHDRDQLPCRKPDCDTLVMDQDPLSAFCQGCGPKTIVRYCSFQHQVEDIGEHWMQCGDPSLVMQCVIDHATAPAFFSDKPPGIADRHGIHGLKSAELQRQKIYFMKNGGYYTLFDPVTHNPKTLSWSKTDPRWQKLNGRIERLLNIAFFGTHKRGVITYIYRLLCELLCSTGEWTEQICETLNTQIQNEFKYAGKLESDAIRVKVDAPCDCEWTGTNFLPHGHLLTCGQGGPATNGQQSPSRGLKSWVERLENKYWVLRAWRQQHPTEKDWHVRANGYGMIPLKPGEEIYKLGPGWTGWGGSDRNDRDPDWMLY